MNKERERRVIVVDGKDNEIALKTYAELKYEDIYRVTALWLTDETGKYYLITQRKWTKHNDPGKWMASVSGTVEEGETYDQNIVTEIHEEIGLTGLELEKVTKLFLDEGKHKFFVQWYKSAVNKEEAKIIIEEDEVEDYKWIAIDELIADVDRNPDKYVPSMRKSLEIIGAIK